MRGSLIRSKSSIGSQDIFRGTIVSENIDLYTVIIALTFKTGKEKENHAVEKIVHHVLKV